MRLQLVCGLDTCDDQCHIISAVGIFSELAELLCNLACCITAYVLMTSGFSFEAIKYVYFGTTLVASLSCVVLSFSINHPISMLQHHQQDFQGRMNATYTNTMQQHKMNNQFKNRISLTIHEDFTHTGMK